MSGLHVGYVLKVYPRLSETFIVNEILELERTGVRVTVLSLRTPREGRFHEKLARVAADVVYLPERGPTELLRLLACRCAELPGSRERVTELLWEEIDRSPDPSVKLLAKAVDLALEARARGIDHLHAHFATSATDVASMGAQLAGIPFSFTAHAKDIYHDDRDAALLDRALARAAFAVTVCDANRPALEREGAAPIHRIYNGLDLEEFRPVPVPRPARPRILGVGRLVPKKGFDLLIRACRVLADAGDDFECRIVGTGLESDRLAAQIEAEGLGGRVELTGALSNGRVREEMVAADVFALPCRVADDGNRDALPTVLLESMALGLPFVSTPVTGIPEIAGDDEGGVLVPEEDPEALAAALGSLLHDPARRARLAARGRSRVERLFDVRRSVAALRERFEGAAGEVPACVSSI